MEKQQLIEYVNWVVDRVQLLSINSEHESAVALLEEFDEWMCPSMVGEILNG
jgi:hypothetical protein